FGVERRLEAADRERAALQNLLRPGNALVLELRDGHDFVDEPHVERLLGAVLAAEVPYLARLLLSDHACKVAGAETTVEAAHLRPDLAKDAIVRRDRQVAHHVEHVTAADGVAGDERDDDLGHRTDQLLHVEHVEPRYAFAVDVAAVAAHGLVTARA